MLNLDFAMPAPALEALLGLTITKLPAARATAYSDSQLLDRLRAAVLGPPHAHGGDLVVVAVLPRPYKRTCKDTGRPRRAFASKNYDRFRPGVTLAQLRRDGVSKRAINRARAEGWLVVRQAKDRAP